MQVLPYLEDVGEDGHGGVDGVGDDEEARLGAALGALLGDALHDRRVRIEKVIAAGGRIVTDMKAAATTRYICERRQPEGTPHMWRCE